MYWWAVQINLQLTSPITCATIITYPSSLNQRYHNSTLKKWSLLLKWHRSLIRNYQMKKRKITPIFPQEQRSAMVTSPYHKHLHPHLRSNIPEQSYKPRSQVSCTYSQLLCLKLSQIGPQKSISSWKAKWIRRVILLNLLSHALLSHNVKKLISKSAHSHLVISNLIKLT